MSGQNPCLVQTLPRPRMPGEKLRTAISVLCALLLLLGVVCPLGLAQKQQKQLTKDEVISLLESGVPPERVEDEARRFGIAFQITGTTERQLRDAGATDTLIRALRQLASKPTVATPPPRQPAVQTPPATSPPILLVETYPGGSQVYIDDEPMGTTSPQGMLKLSRLSPGAHRVRISLAGYQDYIEDVDLAAGATKRLVASLERTGRARGSSSEPTVPQESQPPPLQPEEPAGLITGPQGAMAQAQDQILATFLVQHDHGAAGSDYCSGHMAVGRQAVHFQSLTNPTHSFSIPYSEIKEAKRNAVYLAAIGAFHIKTKSGQNMNFCVVNNIGMAQSPNEILNAINQAMRR